MIVVETSRRYNTIRTMCSTFRAVHCASVYRVALSVKSWAKAMFAKTATQAIGISILGTMSPVGNSLCWSHWLWWSASLLVESAVCLKLLNSSSLCVLLTVCPRFSVCSTWWIVRSSRPSAVQVKFALCYSIEYVCYIVYTFKC